nr:ribonuclease H-like domain-containing protein [Tanacetum cinerariifolium]
MVEGDKPPKDKSQEEGSSSELKLDIYVPLYLHPQDIGSQLITFKLKGNENYKGWSAAVQLALHTRNKSGFINGCVSLDLYKCQVFSKNAKNVWDELKETYDKQDDSMIYKLHHKLYTLTKFGMSLSEYYHKCNSLWRLMQFLMGLDDVFNSVRGIILTAKPIPDVKSAFTTLSRDESHTNSNIASKSVKSGLTAFAVKQIRSYKLGNILILKDVLVVPGYHDLTQKFLMGTSSERGCLYFLIKQGTKDTRYATETDVSEGLPCTILNDDEYECEGEDIEYFGQLFESPEPVVG